jgi:hypothetical protein
MDKEVKKRTRGKGTKPALVHVNLRLPLWVVEYYKEKPNYTGAMREVLTIHARDNQIEDNTPS